MIKQRTTNTFQGGMVQDTSPLNSEQTNLRDCLNGTLISNDGDEMILQNDMGNARVFQIRLDSGYVPVGMCVHGGVTYIASYNPITNKGQVGSFPSPQESYFSQSWGKDSDMTALCGTLGNGKLEFIQQLFPTDTIIRPGDRFDIFVSDEHYFDKTLISNTDNILNGLPASPKNKAVTISVCIADSSGNLHDITPTLKRFKLKSNKEKEFDDDSLIKSNTGTIFQKYPSANLGENGSIVDQYDVDPKNIYNHKISGNLFLVYRLNTLDSVDISAEFLKGPVIDKDQYLDLERDASGVSGNIEEGELDVVFDVTYRYNSPDGYYKSEKDITGTYADLHGQASDFNPQKVINGIQAEQQIDGAGATTVALEFDANDSEISKPVYNFDSNLYSSRQRYLLEGVSIKDKHHIKYNLIPSTIYGNLDFFKQEIEVDLEKLNSGEVSIYQWRYFVEDSGININWGLQSYPFIGTRLTNVQLEFFNLSNPSEPPYTYGIGERTSYHGNFQNYISFDNLKKRQVYCVGISYQLTNIINGKEPTGKFYAGFRILITTKLYNKIYINQNILDFNNLEKSTYEELHSFNPKSVHQVRDGSDQSVLSVEGSPLIIGTTSKKTDKVEKTKKVEIVKEVVSTLDTKDEELYPFDIRDVTYKYGQLTDAEDNKDIDGELTIQGQGKDEAALVKSTVESEVQKLTSVVSQDGSIKVTGNLKSLFTGKINTERSVTFPKALMQYFPKFSGDETGYKKEQHEKLFGYPGYSNLTYPYYIAYGETHRGLSGHKDHHGVKYIEVDRSNGNTNQDDQTMKDLHSLVYGTDWNYPDVYAVGDSHKQFNMANFLRNSNFINIQKGRTFIFFHTENITYDNKSVSDWVGCYRRGGGGNDNKIVTRGTKDLLFWKEGDQLYLVRKSGTGNNTKSYTPQEFCSLMSNIFIKTQDDVTMTDSNILSPVNNAYNLDYEVRLKYKSDITPKYKVCIHGLVAEYDSDTDGVGINFDNLFKNLEEAKIDPAELSELRKYTQFIFDNSPQSSPIEFTIGMEGMEDIQDMAVMLDNGIYDVPVLIGEDNKMYLKDSQNNPLLLSQSYELATVDGKRVPCKFGTKDSNNAKIKSNIKIENGKIIPGRPKSTSMQLVTGGSGHQKTTLNLNSQITIQLI